MLSVDGVHTLINVVIVNSIQVDLVSWFVIFCAVTKIVVIQA
jgi:hypothetical protein